jgi:hypothetical protein
MIYIFCPFSTGNMWGQQWNNIAKYVLPYPDKESIDVTPKLKEKVMSN